MTPAAVEAAGLRYSYGEREALRGVTFRVEAGEVFGLLGPNGGGKTTLFRILGTLLRPQAGSVRVFGFDAAADPFEIRRRIGVVFQSQSLDRRLSVEENLGCQARLYGLNRREAAARIDEALGATGLTDRRRDLVDKLSGGLRRRVELAKALLHRPRLLLLDEPSTGVDPRVRLEFWDYLQSLRRDSGVTILLTTHLLEEADKCDRLAILDRGELIAEGAPADLNARIGGEIVTFTVADPGALAALLRDRFEIEGQVVEGAVRFERQNGAQAVAALLKELPPTVEAVTIARPTLEDVFVQATGHGFERSAAADAEG